MFITDDFQKKLDEKDIRKQMKSISELILLMNQIGRQWASKNGGKCYDILTYSDIISMGVSDTLNLAKAINQEFNSIANEVKQWRLI